MSKRLSLAVLWALTTGAGAAGAPVTPPVVIHDGGDTRPLAPYYAAITPHRPDAHTRTARSQADSARYLPLRTPELTPGTVRRRSLEHAPLRPLFVIGADPTSRRWLATYHDPLVHLGAVGLLVQAETPADVRAIARIGSGLTITPVAGGDLARTLGLRHYPALISREGIEQ